MKVIDEIKIKYMVPESTDEQEKINKILENVENEKQQKTNFDEFTVVKNNQKHSNGFWKQVV